MDHLHKHLIIRAEVKSPPQPTDCDAVCDWMSNMIAAIGMKELAAPRARYCFVKGNRGLTSDAIIETSHICVHTWDECSPPVMQLDVYTCSDLNPDDIFEHLTMFEPTKIEWKFLDRQHGLTLLDQSQLFRVHVDALKARIKRFAKFLGLD